MAGLFDTLNLGSRSLATYRQAIDTTGHNLANVHTAGYTRQRLEIEAVATPLDPLGEAGSGSEAVRIVRLHNAFLDRQALMETSVEGSLQEREDLLRQALSSLNESVAQNADGKGAASLSGGLSDFFTALQSASSNPSSIPERQVLLQKAQALATRFNQVDGRLETLESAINEGLQTGVDKVNSLLSDIAKLNESILVQEGTSGASANTLRDARQGKLEELSRLVRIEASEQPSGAVNVLIGGRLLVEEQTLQASLETFDAGGGRLLVGVAGEGTELPLGSGALQGAIQIRDGELAGLRENINSVASLLISEVNALHAQGFSLTGSTGVNFFTGTNASDIQVNLDLLANPALFQASGDPNAVGDNQVILSLARLASKAHPSLNGATFLQKHLQTVAWMGQEVANNSAALQDQKIVHDYLSRQRNAISGVSIDEEMSNLVMFQKAFQASARLISMTDEMLATIIAM